jgi:hypothetical protein
MPQLCLSFHDWHDQDFEFVIRPSFDFEPSEDDDDDFDDFDTFEQYIIDDSQPDLEFPL